MNLPTPPPTTIWQDMAAFQRYAEDIQARISDPTQKRMLGDLLQQLSVARAHAQEVVPGVLTTMKKDVEAQQAELPKVTAELERLQAELEAKHAEAQKFAEQAAAPAASVEPALDPHKSRQLSEELRNRFGPLKAPEEGSLQDAGSVAREWVDTEAHDPADAGPTRRPPTMRPPSAKPPEPPRPAEEEPKKGDDDIWEGLSRMEGE